MYQFKTNLAEFEALDCGREGGGGGGKGRECVGWMPEGARVGTALRQHHGFYVFNSVIVTKIRYIHSEMVLCVVSTTAHTQHFLPIGHAQRKLISCVRVCCTESCSTFLL